jgi:hypothetical protein
MSIITVHIEENAFMTMFLASAEAYPSRFRPGMSRRPNGTLPEGEAYGLLFGQKLAKTDEEVFNVALAVPCQIVMNRDADGIEIHGVHFYRILELAELFPAYQFLGTYHSHPYLEGDFDKKNSVNPSSSDRQTSLETADEVEKSIIDVIVAMSCLKQKTEMQPEVVAPHIIHNGCGDYLYSLGCCRSDYATKMYDPVDRLCCPAASVPTYADFSAREVEATQETI